MSLRDCMGELDLICHANYDLSIHDRLDKCFRVAYVYGNLPFEFVHDELGILYGLARFID